jgi:hypothetical protein
VEVNFRAIGVLLYTIIYGENPFQCNKDILAYTGKLPSTKEVEHGILQLITRLEEVIGVYALH